MSCLVGKPTMWLRNRSDTNQAVQSQKRARRLKFRILVEEELYYLSSENKGADQLRSYCEADLRLCFRHADCWFSHVAAHMLVPHFRFLHIQKQRPRSAVHNCTADQCFCFHYSDSTIFPLLNPQKFKILAFFCGCIGQFVSDLVEKPEDWFSCVTALLYCLKILLLTSSF